MNRLLLGILISAATCLTLVSISVSQEQAGAEPPKRARRQQLKEIKLRESELTERQKAHRRMMQTAAGPKLRDLAAKGEGEIVVGVDEPLRIETDEGEATRRPTLHSAVCNPEAIVVGELTSETPLLTADGSFLFTEYTLAASEILKDNAAGPIRPGEELTVLREGGTGTIGGRTVRALREGFRPFSVGQRYALFLRYKAETGAYLAYPYGSFKLIEGRVLPYGMMPEEAPAEEAAFLDAVRAAVNAGGCPH